MHTIGQYPEQNLYDQVIRRDKISARRVVSWGVEICAILMSKMD